MTRIIHALAAWALLGFIASAAIADEAANVQSDGATLQTAVLHSGNTAEWKPVWWGYGSYGGWGWDGFGHSCYGYGGVGYGSWYAGWNGGWWPDRQPYCWGCGSGYPYYGGYGPYPSTPYWAWGWGGPDY